MIECCYAATDDGARGGASGCVGRRRFGGDDDDDACGDERVISSFAVETPERASRIANRGFAAPGPQGDIIAIGIDR